VGKSLLEVDLVPTATDLLTQRSFYRSLPLPFDVTPEQVTATLTDGVQECPDPQGGGDQTCGHADPRRLMHSLAPWAGNPAHSAVPPQ
jgi:hypothetical protein